MKPAIVVSDERIDELITTIHGFLPGDIPEVIHSFRADVHTWLQSLPVVDLTKVIEEIEEKRIMNRLDDSMEWMAYMRVWNTAIDFCLAKLRSAVEVDK